MGLGRMVGGRRVDGVGGVKVGVEGERVVVIALQGSDAVVMRASQMPGSSVSTKPAARIASPSGGIGPRREGSSTMSASVVNGW